MKRIAKRNRIEELAERQAAIIADLAALCARLYVRLDGDRDTLAELASAVDRHDELLVIHGGRLDAQRGFMDSLERTLQSRTEHLA